jgi:hypothetical protein
MPTPSDEKDSHLNPHASLLEIIYVSQWTKMCLIRI